VEAPVETTLIVSELLIGIALIVIVLLQAKGTSASVFGGRNTAASYRTRRGLEKTLYSLTIVLAGVFVVMSLLHPLLKKI
jgi:preprotein translocase subunit SecG